MVKEEITRDLVIGYGYSCVGNNLFSGNVSSDNKPYYFSLFAGTYVFEDGTKKVASEGVRWRFNGSEVGHVLRQINRGAWVVISGLASRSGDGMW